MITQKFYWGDEEIIIFDRGLSEDGLRHKFRFYRLKNIPDDCSFEVMENPDDSVLLSIAVNSGVNVTRQYYVTPPDTLEWWMGSYIYFPDGTFMHCDPIAYGEDRETDISENTAEFMKKHYKQIINPT